MSLMETLVKNNLKARKEQDKVESGLLTTLIHEARMVGKNDGNRESTDEEVIRTIRKFIKTLEETRTLLNSKGPFDETTPEGMSLINAAAKTNYEISSLEKYIPKQMTDDDIRAVILKFVATTPGANIGSVMKFLKEFHLGMYDGKAASRIAKEVL